MKMILWWHGFWMVFGKMVTPLIWITYILWLITGGALMSSIMPYAIVTHLLLFITGYNW